VHRTHTSQQTGVESLSARDVSLVDGLPNRGLRLRYIGNHHVTSGFEAGVFVESNDTVVIHVELNREFSASTLTRPFSRTVDRLPGQAGITVQSTTGV
jgi:hypothetical protein